MRLPRAFLLCLAATLCVLQAACSTAALSPAAPPVASDLGAQYSALAANGGRVLALQPDASQLRIYVFRAGRAAQLGHNHVLTAPTFQGYVYWPAGANAPARLDLVFRLDQLVFDEPAQRAQLGPAFAAVLSDAAIAATRDHMLGPDNMQADRYPEVRIHSQSIHGEAPWFSARVAVTLHGQTRELQVPLHVTGLPQRVQASGSLVLRQSDFGVQPYSVMGGLLAVQDDVVVAFSLVGE